MNKFVTFLSKYNINNHPIYSRLLIKMRFSLIKTWKLYYKPYYSLINRKKIQEFNEEIEEDEDNNLKKKKSNNSDDNNNIKKEKNENLKDKDKNILENERFLTHESKNKLFRLLKITEKDHKILKDAISLIVKSIIIPLKISEIPKLNEIFNLIPEIEKNENLKLLFQILIAEKFRLKGNIIIEKLFLEEAIKNLTKKFGKYNLLLFPLYLQLSKSNRELGFLDESFSYINNAYKIGYFHADYNCLEVFVALEEFILFSKFINETSEEGVYSEIMGKIVSKNLKIINKKLLKTVRNLKVNQDNKSLKRNFDFEKFKYFSFENKIEALIYLSYYMKHLDHLSTFGKRGNNTDYILKNFTYCEEILENMGILHEKKQLNFHVLFDDIDHYKRDDESLSELMRRYEDKEVYFYLHPQIKSYINNNDLNNKNEIEKNSKYKPKKDESYTQKNFTALQKIICDIILHRFQILKFLSPQDKHIHLIEAFKQVTSNHILVSCKERAEYELIILSNILHVLAKADEHEKFLKFYDIFKNSLEKLHKKKSIVYYNRIINVIKQIAKATSSYPRSSSEIFLDKVCDDFGLVEQFYTDFFELTPEILNQHKYINYNFADLFVCGTYFYMCDNKIEDALISMMLALEVYQNKLGKSSQSYFEAASFIIQHREKSSMNEYDVGDKE